MNQNDQQKVNWLMENPLAAMAWSEEIISEDAGGEFMESQREIALACLIATPSNASAWGQREWGALNRGRMRILSDAKLAPQYRELICDCFEREGCWQQKEYWSVGAGSWSDFFEKAGSHGVDADTRSVLAKRASASPMMSSWLGSKADDELKELFRINSRSLGESVSGWRQEIAARLSTDSCFELLESACFSGPTSRGSLINPLNGLDPQTARMLAAKAMSSPRRAYQLARALLFSSHVNAPDGVDALAVVLNEFEANPAIQMVAPEGRSVEKVFKSSHGPLSLAMQLMCKNRPEAAVAAAKWAVALGGKGRSPQNFRSDGITTVNFSMRVLPFRSRTGGMAVGTLAEAALALLSKDAMLAFADMGFPLPKKDIALSLASAAGRIGAVMSLKEKQELREIGADPVQYEARMLALWEEVAIIRMMERKKSPADPDGTPQAKRGALRM